MYQALEAEMERQGLNYKQLILKAGMIYQTIQPKLRGRGNAGDLTLIEAEKLKRALGVNTRIEDLFNEDIEKAQA